MQGCKKEMMALLAGMERIWHRQKLEEQAKAFPDRFGELERLRHSIRVTPTTPSPRGSLPPAHFSTQTQGQIQGTPDLSLFSDPRPIDRSFPGLPGITETRFSDPRMHYPGAMSATFPYTAAPSATGIGGISMSSMPAATRFHHTYLPPAVPQLQPKPEWTLPDQPFPLPLVLWHVVRVLPVLHGGRGRALPDKDAFLLPRRLRGQQLDQPQPGQSERRGGGRRQPQQLTDRHDDRRQDGRVCLEAVLTRAWQAAHLLLSLKQETLQCALVIGHRKEQIANRSPSSSAPPCPPTHHHVILLWGKPSVTVTLTQPRWIGGVPNVCTHFRTKFSLLLVQVVLAGEFGMYIGMYRREILLDSFC
ncbi:hypothetical protein lerEdw1_004984 [Lerista edwardsae]|nr:hypothetical protein lerEdw1_004984 [Lerista edwardsae]